ncbi:MAG: SCO family protein [Burkholderiaceae bacterium]
METKRLLLKALGGAALIPAVLPSTASARNWASEGRSYFPNVELVTHEGKKVKFFDDLVEGKIVVFNMMYATCTGVCPINTASLLNLQQTLGPRVGKDVFIYSISLQPELDSPAVLRDYMKRYGVGPGWTFLTGKRENVELIRRKLGFYDSDPEADKDISQHIGVLRIGDGSRHKWFMTSALIPASKIVKSINNL